MPDRIEKFVDQLTAAELRRCAEIIKKRLSKSGGRPRGRSKDEYHTVCRLVAYATLRARQEWLDDNPGRKRVPKNFVLNIIGTELRKHPALVRRREAIAVIQRHVDKRIREFLPRTLRKAN